MESMRLRRGLSLLCWMGLMLACHHIAPLSSLPLQSLSPHGEHKAFVATVTLDVQLPDQQWLLKGDVLIAWPNQLRLVLRGPHGGPLLAMVSDGQTLTAIDFVHQHIIQGACATLDVASLLPFQLPLSWSIEQLIAMLAGQPDKMHAWHQVKLLPQGEPPCRQLLGASPGARDCQARQCQSLKMPTDPNLLLPPPSEALWLAQDMVCVEQGQTAWQVQWSHFDAWALPQHIEIQLFKPWASRLTWQLFQRSWIAQPAPAVFVLRHPSGWPVLGPDQSPPS